MHDDLLKRLEQKMDRRSFLRGSALTAAAFAAIPLAARAQDQQAPPQDKPKSDEKAEEKDQKAADKEESKNAKKDKDDAEKDPFKETKLDANGREYRMCPQCGYNMYRQDRTWTCENCGYSYVE